MKDLVGVVAACGLVRLFWDGVMGWAKFYQRHNIDYIVYKNHPWESDMEKRGFDRPLRPDSTAQSVVTDYERWCRDFGLPAPSAKRRALGLVGLGPPFLRGVDIFRRSISKLICPLRGLLLDLPDASIVG